MSSKKLNRTHYRFRTNPVADSHQHGKNKLVERRLKTRVRQGYRIVLWGGVITPVTESEAEWIADGCKLADMPF